jgi:hypothetical protein
LTREEKLTELARITKRLRDYIGSTYLPSADTRRYNQLMAELYGIGEDPEVQEAKNHVKEINYEDYA